MIPTLALAFVCVAPDSRFHPIVVKEPGASHAAFIGASSRKAWVSAESALPRVTGGEKYRLYGAGRPLAAIGGKAGPMDDTGQPFVTLKPSPSAKTVLIGVSGGWRVEPRKMAWIKPGPRIAAAVKAFLRSRSLSRASVRLKQVLSGDLNGDGKAETLIVAERYASAKSNVPDSASPGDYSVVLVLPASGKGAQRVASEVYPPVKPAAEPAPPNVRKIIGVLDLNGDGRMEVVVQWQYYEGGGFDVYTFDGIRPKRVLAWSAGL